MTDPAASILDIYRRHAHAWTGARTAAPLREKAWLDRFADLMAPAAEILDIGCGSGVPVGRHFIGRGHDVTGVDGAAEMIALFRKNLPDQTAHVADMRTLALGTRFGGLIAWDSFFHLSEADQPGMFPIFRDHAAPGAPLMFTSGPKAGVAMGALEGEPLFHASLAPDAYRALLDGHGFDVIVYAPEEPESRRTIWLARRRG